MIPRILHFVWIGGQVPMIHQANIATFRHHNPGFTVNVWQDAAIVSELGIDLEELRCLFPQSAGVSNVVRLKALLLHGGLYFDTDFICHRPLDPLLPFEAVASLQDETRICNAFMGVVPGHPWIQWQLDHIGDWNGHGPEWGVYNATNAPRDGLTLVPPDWIYPYTYGQTERTVKPDTLAEHLWEGSWV